MNQVRIFLSFDMDHDDDLHDRLVRQSQQQSSPFEIVARSQAGDMTDRWGDRVRCRIREVDEVIVICGEHTESSVRVSAELRIAREEQKPYFLLWGRRELMCTKPLGARPDDGMYSWTWDIVQEQVATTLRNARPLQIAERFKRP